MSRAIRNTGKVPAFFSEQVLEATRFYLDAKSRARRPLAVICGGCEHCEAGYRISRDDFPFHSLEFVARGRGTLTLQGQAVPLFPGTTFSYGPGVPHTIVTDAERPLVKYFVDFTGPQAARLLAEHDLAPGTVVQAASPDVILRVFDDLVVNGTGGSRYRPLVCATLVELLVLKVAEVALTDRACHTPAFATYQVCREFIRDHYLTVKTLEEVAEACHVDEAYLCRLFKRFDSQSPYQYLMQLKMSEAARRLQRQPKLAKEIAFDLGFENPFHFSRAFKRVFGLSPAVFRQLR